MEIISVLLLKKGDKNKCAFSSKTKVIKKTIPKTVSKMVEILKEEEILDYPNNRRSQIWIETSKKMLLISSISFIAGCYSISQSKNEPSLINIEDYPEVLGCFLLFLTTICGVIGLKYWKKNLSVKESNRSSEPITLVMHIIILIPSIFGAIQFIFAYGYNYLYSLVN